MVWWQCAVVHRRQRLAIDIRYILQCQTDEFVESLPVAPDSLLYNKHLIEFVTLYKKYNVVVILYFNKPSFSH